MDSDPETREIVRTVIMLAHNLDLAVVAEGAETKGQVDDLKELDCEMAQGYFFARPADSPVMSELLVSNYHVGVSRLSWKWRKRSSVKIAERTYEKRAQALHC
jgi:predicted signal transduction protein with EAL and GGDEF domain